MQDTCSVHALTTEDGEMNLYGYLSGILEEPGAPKSTDDGLLSTMPTEEWLGRREQEYNNEEVEIGYSPCCKCEEDSPVTIYCLLKWREKVHLFNQRNEDKRVLVAKPICETCRVSFREKRKEARAKKRSTRRKVRLGEQVANQLASAALNMTDHQLRTIQQMVTPLMPTSQMVNEAQELKDDANKYPTDIQESFKETREA